MPFKRELAVMVVRTKDGVVSYPVAETRQKDSICHVVLAPAQLSAQCAKQVSYGSYGLKAFFSPRYRILSSIPTMSYTH